MRKKALWIVVVVLLITSVFFQGCATRSIPLGKRDLATLAPLRVATCVRPYEGVYVRHSGGETAATIMTLGSIIGGIVTREVVRAWERGLRKEIVAAGVPRYYELVMKKFCERASKEIPDWPPMDVVVYPVDKRYVKKIFKNKSGFLLLFVPAYYTAPTLSTAHGLESEYRAVIYDTEAHVVWVEDFEYSSKKYDRYRKIKEYKADNFKLLKEEIEFTAETTASYFIESILQAIGTPQQVVQSEGGRRVISPGKLSQEETQLKEVSDDYGIVSITSYPSGARVFIDGEFRGQTPAEMLLNTGTYQLFLQHQFYESYVDSVTIEKDQTETLNIRLSPEGKEQR